MQLIIMIDVIQNMMILKLGMRFCDKTMYSELNGIVNPTLRERIDKSIVGNSSKLKLISGWAIL